MVDEVVVVVETAVPLVGVRLTGVSVAAGVKVGAAVGVSDGSGVSVTVGVSVAR